MRHRSCVRTGNSQAASAQRTSASDIQLAISACPHMVHKHNSAHGVHGRRNLISKNTEGVGFLQLYMGRCIWRKNGQRWSPTVKSSTSLFESQRARFLMRN